MGFSDFCVEPRAGFSAVSWAFEPAAFALPRRRFLLAYAIYQAEPPGQTGARVGLDPLYGLLAARCWRVGEPGLQMLRRETPSRWVFLGFGSHLLGHTFGTIS